VGSLLDTDELGDAEPWMSPGATAQRPPRLLLTLLGDYWWQRHDRRRRERLGALPPVVTEQGEQQPRRPGPRSAG